MHHPGRLTLNSSEISETKDEICFMSRSTLLSLPVFSSVVMAKVAMLRLESVIRFSRSRLHAVTADGCFIATWLAESARAKRHLGRVQGGNAAGAAKYLVEGPDCRVSQRGFGRTAEELQHFRKKINK